MRETRMILLVLAVAFAMGQPAFAQDEAEAEVADPYRGSISGDLRSLDDAELDARIAFIEERMDDGQLHSQIWQYGFTGGYSAGAAIGASTTGDNDDRVNHIVTGVKGVIGVTRLLMAPHPGRHGADPIREVQGDTREDKIERLVVAEDLLEENAKRSESRWAWQRHATNLGLNVAGGIVVGTLGSTEDAIISSVLGFAVGEAMAFSMPWRYTGDRDDYRQEFEGGIQQSRIQWQLSPMVSTDGSAGV